MNLETEPIGQETLQGIREYKEVCDPLQMMGLLVELMCVQGNKLTDGDRRQIAGCHNLLAAIFRNE